MLHDNFNRFVAQKNKRSKEKTKYFAIFVPLFLIA